MAAFFCKLIPPRPTFANDMTAQEMALMQEHAAYWTQGIANGHVIVFGFVADPRAAYGIGVVEVPDEASVDAFTAEDPVIRARKGFHYEILTMPLGAGHR